MIDDGKPDATSFREVLTRVEAVELDAPGAHLPFSARLARDNGWSTGFAERVVTEYRRFVVMAVVAGHPVTPSDQVDQAWHLHLVYSRSYWDDLCRDALGFPLHHGPTAGGSAEGAKYRDWYARTLESYRRWFGEEPPADIWPTTRDRFADAHRFRRVNEADHWVIPKPSFARPGRGGPARALGGAALAGLTLTGCLAVSGTTGVIADGSSGTDRVVAIVIIAAVIVVLGVIVLSVMRRFGRSDGGTGCSGGDGGANRYGLLLPGDDGYDDSGGVGGDGGGGDAGGSGCSGCGGCGS